LAHGRLIAMPDRATKTLYLEGKADRFTRELLLKATGMKRIKEFVGPETVLSETIGNKTIRIIRSVPSLDLACDEQADIVVTRYYMDTPCPGTLVVDRHKLEERGGAALWLERTPRIAWVYAGAGRRPWQQQSDLRGWYSRKDEAKLVDKKRIKR